MKTRKSVYHKKTVKHYFAKYGLYIAGILLILASYLLTDRYFEGNFAGWRYCIAIICFISSIVSLIKRGKEKGEIK